MTSVAFDTHRAVKALREAGVEERQAEAITQVVQQTADLPDISTLVTKIDLAMVKTDLGAVKADLAVVKADLEGAISKLETKLVWLIVALGAIGAFSNGGFAFLTRLFHLG